MTGPLPDPHAVRRNQPTIPTTSLTRTGRTTPPPDAPEWCELLDAGRKWWAWAWATPQALGWGDSVGMESVIARRASLEDDLGTLEFVHNLDLLDDEFQSDTAKALRAAVQRLASMATGRLAVMREMRELDDRLGLTPKGLAQLRWQIVEDAPAQSGPVQSPDEVTARRDRKTRLAAGE